MIANFEDRIDLFLRKSPRNKLIFIVNDLIIDLPSIDIGLKLSSVIQHSLNHKQISMIASDALETIMHSNSREHPVIGNYTAIRNIGILFEKSLKIDFIHFLETHSKNQTLIVEWKGEIEKNKLFFLSKDRGLHFDISKLSHINI